MGGFTPKQYQNSTKTVPKQYQENRASGYIGAPGGTLGAELGTVVTPSASPRAAALGTLGAMGHPSG